MRRLPILAVLVLLGGCSSLPPILGVVSGAVAGGATANPAVAFAVGVGVDVASDYGLKYYGRSRQQAEQDAIAEVAGGLDVGGKASWQIRHYIPLGDEHGELQVVRLIPNPLSDCREIAFSVEDGAKRAWYLADLCQQNKVWKWATAEPAVARWGFLQ